MKAYFARTIGTLTLGLSMMAASPSFARETVTDADLRSAGVIGQSLAVAEDGLIAEGYVSEGSWRVTFAGCSPEGGFNADRVFSSNVEHEKVQLIASGTRKGGLRLFRFEVKATDTPQAPSFQELCLQ